MFRYGWKLVERPHETHPKPMTIIQLRIEGPVATQQSQSTVETTIPISDPFPHFIKTPIINVMNTQN
jgi:hypothetical protein